MSTNNLYPSVPLEPITNVEESLRKKMNDMNSFYKSN